jgi:hypothetical protein
VQSSFTSESIARENNIGNMGGNEGKASWTTDMESYLLDCVLTDKSDPELYTGKGLKTHAWRQIQQKLEKRFTLKFNGQGKL